MSRTRGEGLAIRPGELIGSAGEAAVYAVRGHPDLVFKRYHRPTPERARKLDVMVGTQPDDPTWATLRHRSIAWPLNVVVDARGQCEGFVMPRIRRAVSLAAVSHPRDRRRLGWDWTWRHLLRVAQNLSSATAALHRSGFVIGDINTQNILVTEQALVTVIDCDSMQIPLPGGRHLRCLVGTPDFTAPETSDRLATRSFAEIDRNPEGDNYALAILLYMLLVEGTHPYAGQWRGPGDPPTRARRMRDGLFANGGDRRVTPPTGAPPFDVCPPDLQILFRAAFVDGAIRPILRPSAEAWRDAMASVDHRLIGCTRNPNHVYANHRTRCPWCERITALGIQDPFPHKGAHKATQRPAVAPKAQASTQGINIWGVSLATKLIKAAGRLQPLRWIRKLIWVVAIWLAVAFVLGVISWMITLWNIFWAGPG